eukprot:1137008-Pelagomonas_calceolata.AAC.7
MESAGTRASTCVVITNVYLAQAAPSYTSIHQSYTATKSEVLVIAASRNFHYTATPSIYRSKRIHSIMLLLSCAHWIPPPSTLHHIPSLQAASAFVVAPMLCAKQNAIEKVSKQQPGPP